VCGIAGVFRLGSGRSEPPAIAEDRALVVRMLAKLRHRGPDDEGLESLGKATLGARRLSILDLAGGHQPLADPEARVWAVQNGEIYNFPALRRDLEPTFRFRTRTDTEILPALHLRDGKAGIESLRGMFACAIFDRRDETLLLARDPLGVKPLYYASVADRLVFASEIKALLTIPKLSREWDEAAVAMYFTLGFIPGEATPFRSIRKLRPGCRLLATAGGFHIERYWPWPAFGASESSNPRRLGEVVDEATTRLRDSVSSMLLSDVPVGLLLSGGLDSSVLAALLPAEVRRELRTFTIGFENAGRHDERADAREVARALGTRHAELQVALNVAEELPAVVRHLDEPCSDPAALPAHLVSRAAASQVKVLLSGTGGDEIFGGYRRYRLAGLLRSLGWMPRGLAASGARWLGNRAQHRASNSAERLVWLRKLLEARSRNTFADSYLSIFESATPAKWQSALRSNTTHDQIVAALIAEMTEETGSLPRSDEGIAFATDHLYYLPDDLLLKEDRTTMGASVEGRVPYLDDALVRFAAGIPLAMKIDGRRGKIVLREIAKRVLPPAVAERPKHGFSVPIEDWLRGPLDALLGDLFQGEGSGVLDHAAVRAWHDQHRDGMDRSGALWTAMSFELWWREVGSVAAEPLAPIDATGAVPAA
jgi:asparagine synthase (glutamine-hydrolysing)